MNSQEDFASINRRHWDRMAIEKCSFTLPWLHLDRAIIRQYSDDPTVAVPEVVRQMTPPRLLAHLDNKDVLCIASGGGQQSAVFGLLGARVTVVDISAKQLLSDKAAADHYHYPVTTIQADMRDLGCLTPESFDLVFQAPSMAYVPDARQVYGQVSRVLRPNGIYRVEFTNPALEFIDCSAWSGTGYAITTPYANRIRQRPDCAVEFRHYMRDIFNGLICLGLSIDQVEDNDFPETQLVVQMAPGSWQHSLGYLVGFVVVAKKASHG
jgi:2-polyprenyl-3-methyl-5-hydroxy-6-metoxy-1,4-benzoquinol methylase